MYHLFWYNRICLLDWSNQINQISFKQYKLKSTLLYQIYAILILYHNIFLYKLQGVSSLFRIWLSRRCVHVFRAAFNSGFSKGTFFASIFIVPNPESKAALNTWTRLLDSQTRNKKETPRISFLVCAICIFELFQWLALEICYDLCFCFFSYFSLNIESNTDGVSLDGGLQVKRLQQILESLDQTDVGGQHCPCLVFVRIFRNIVSDVCLLSGFCPYFSPDFHCPCPPISAM